MIKASIQNFSPDLITKEIVIYSTDGYIEHALQKYNEDINEVQIIEIEDLASKLTIKDVDDKDGYKLVRALRMKTRDGRTAIGKRYKVLNEKAKKFTEKIRGRKTEIEDRLKLIESGLSAKEKVIDDEVLRVKNEAAELEKKRIKDRTDGLYSAGMSFNGLNYIYNNLEISPEAIPSMPDSEYNLIISTVKKEVEIAAVALAEFQLEQDKQDRIREAQDKKDKELKDKQDKIDADRKALDDEKNEKILEAARIEENKRIEKETEERVQREERDKIIKEKADKEEAERAAKLEAELAEKLKPDNEKLSSLANQLSNIALPELSNKESTRILHEAMEHISSAVDVLNQVDSQKVAHIKGW